MGKSMLYVSTVMMMTTVVVQGGEGFQLLLKGNWRYTAVAVPRGNE